MTRRQKHKARVDPFFSCIDNALLRQTIQSAGIEADGLTVEEMRDIYSENHDVSSVSPNLIFDEAWYLANYRDVATAVARGVFVSGFMHFIDFGLFEGRWPSESLHQAQLHGTALPRLETLDADAYRARHEPARTFLDSFPIIDATSYYNNYGRFLGLAAAEAELQADANTAHDPTDRERMFFDALSHALDVDWYRRTYLSDRSDARFQDDPLTHYLVQGMLEANSPGPSFDEKFYRAFYPEIQHAIDRGEIPSGFYHYVVAGRAENRLPAYERKEVLEARMPGVTKPVLLERTPHIERRTAPRQITVDYALAPRVWVLLPTINPDITFGGYRSVLELIRRLHETGRRVTVVCTEDGNASREYFLFRESSEAFRRVFQQIEVIGQADSFRLTVGSHDMVLAYSLWDLYAADEIRRAAPSTRVVLLAQEFEPIFYDNCAARAIAEEAYRIPHFPLINSAFLRRFFEMHRIGVFHPDANGGRKPVERRDFAVFEHRINRLAEQSVAQMLRQGERVLVTYARPEGHAARNMFEILILALRRVCGEGGFGPEWSFIGLGALSELEPITLSDQHKLVIHAKMTEEEYTRYVNKMDIGVSLMYAPHPSVVPFEFATTGALVVTNEYENRSAKELAAISPNIIAGRPTVDGIAACLREAIRRVPDAKRRAAGIYKVATSSWTDIFNDEILDTVCGPNLPAALSPAVVERRTGV